MKIVSLRAENVKRLRAVEITPDGDLVVIAGRNGQGKSSVLDSIWMALAGAAGSKETTRPIRDGEEKASVELDLGDLRVTRRWTKAGTTLEVSSADGARYPSPQRMLDSLIGRLTFDPLAFAQDDPRGQRSTLLEVLELPFDPDELSRRRSTAFEERTNVNRDGKAVAARLAALEPVPDDTPDEELSAFAIAQELEEARETQRRVTELDAAVDAAGEEIHELEERVRELEEELAAARAKVDEERAAGVDLAADLARAQEDAVDPTPIAERLASVEETNALVRRKHDRARLEAELEELRGKSQALTDRLAAIDAERDAGIAAAKMPLDGLSFDDEGVLWQGVPFSQASSAEQLRASVAVAMALNPSIRVLRIADGSLLDSSNLELVASMAAEHDFQVWLERVDETGKVGVVIEDGRVVGQDLEADVVDDRVDELDTAAIDGEQEPDVPELES